MLNSIFLLSSFLLVPPRVWHSKVTTKFPPGDSETPGSPTTGLTAVQRKKKPKRRSTGVLSAEVVFAIKTRYHHSLQDIGPRSDESADEVGWSFIKIKDYRMLEAGKWCVLL